MLNSRLLMAEASVGGGSAVSSGDLRHGSAAAAAAAATGATECHHLRTKQQHGGNTDATGTSSTNLTSSGNQLHRLRTLGRARDAQRHSAQSDDEGGRAGAGGRSGGGKKSRKKTKGLAGADRRAMLIKSASTSALHRISMPVFRSSFSRSSSRPSTQTGALSHDPDASATTTRSSVSNRSSLASRVYGDSSGGSPAFFGGASSPPSLDTHIGGRTRSESALSSMPYKKSSMTVRTLDESLGRAGPVAEQSVHRRRQLRRFSNEISRAAMADPASPRESLYDSLHRSSSSFRTLNESGKSSLSVSFHKVRIREYPMTVGDNPAVSSGVAVTMDWDPLEQGSQVMELDEYEDTRPERRSMGQMRLPPSERREILRRSGHSASEMQKGLKASNIARRQRTKTLGTLHLQPFEEIRERTSRAVGNALTSTKKQERELMARSLEAELISERQRAEVWAEEEHMAAIELAELEAVLNGEEKQQQPLQAQPVCIDEDEDDQPDIIDSKFNAVAGQAAIEATAASVAAAAMAAGHSDCEEDVKLLQTSTTCQAESPPRERATRTPPLVEEEKSESNRVPKPDKDLKFLLISSVRREMKASSMHVKNEMLSASNELQKFKGFIKNDLSTGGHQLERLSELDIALLNSGIAKLLNNVGCYLYLEKFKSSSVRVLTTALNVLLHISNPEISSGDEDQTPELSDVAHNLRRVLMQLILKKDIGTVGSDFTDSAAVVLSNLLKAMITKETVEVKDSKRPKRSYKVDRGDIITACVLVKTNAELHVWQCQYDDAIVNFGVLRNLLEQRLSAEKDNAGAEVEICEEIISALQRMRVIYDSVYSDSSAAGICLEKIGNYRKKILRQKVEKRSGVKKVSELALLGIY